MSSTQVRTESPLPQVTARGKGSGSQKQVCQAPKPFHPSYHPKLSPQGYRFLRRGLWAPLWVHSELHPMWAGGTLRKR